MYYMAAEEDRLSKINREAYRKGQIEHCKSVEDERLQDGKKKARELIAYLLKNGWSEEQSLVKEIKRIFKIEE